MRQKKKQRRALKGADSSLPSHNITMIVRDINTMSWPELLRLGKEMGVYRHRMTKVQLLKALGA